MRFKGIAPLVLLAVVPVFAQQSTPPPAQSGSQSAKSAQQGPKPKSQKEIEALQKVQAAAQAGNPDAEIQAIQNVLENFVDTEFKPMLLDMAVDAAQAKGDYAQTIAFGEQAIKANPDDITARVTLAELIAGHTRDNDLDKEQSLKKVDDYANKALELLKNASTPPFGIPPERWPDARKMLISQSYDALGQAADLRKNYPQAVQNLKTAADGDPANYTALARLSKAYLDNKQYDDAISTADKVMAVNEAPPQVKQFAQAQKSAATKLKTAK